MFRLALAFCSLAIIGSVSAQSEKGSLTGTISDPNGATVDEAPIQVKNKNHRRHRADQQQVRWPLYARRLGSRNLRVLDRDAVLRV